MEDLEPAVVMRIHRRRCYFRCWVVIFGGSGITADETSVGGYDRGGRNEFASARRLDSVAGDARDVRAVRAAGECYRTAGVAIMQITA